MNLVKSKRLHVLGFSLMMAVLFTIFSFTLVHGANREMKELILNGDCQLGSVNNSSQYYFFKVPSNGRIRIGVSNDELVLRVFRDEVCTDSIAINSNGYANVAAGTYYAEVSGTGTYEISANFSRSSQHDLEPNDTMRDAIPLESGVVMRGNADQVYGDVDWYVLDLKEKSLVRIVLNNNGEFAMVYDERGNAYSSVYRTSIVTWNAGKYYIEVVSSEPSYGYYDISAEVWEYPTPNKITKGVYKGDGKVELTWSKSQYAEGYYLFYKTRKDGSWISLTNITSAEQTTYTHTYGPSNGETYYYGVQAYRSCSVFGEIYNQDDAEGYPVT
ncbi:MAG: hypothetical protein PUB22_09980, partial [Clostridiales bacterium]|nr:hypothetical protein [Clostridiales bacterium]